MTSIQGCSHASVKTLKKNKLWLIDAEVPALYRVTGPGQEQVIPIHRNHKAVEKFMCMDKDELDYQIEGAIK